MWTCGCCNAMTEEAWRSSLHGMACARCHDAERRTVVSLHGRVRLGHSNDNTGRGTARHSGAHHSRVATLRPHQLSA